MPYNDVASADTYFAARYGFAKWGTLTDPVKLSLLTSASQILDQLCTWDGDKTSDAQDGEFPRDGDTTVPQDVKDSECEIAYRIIDEESTSTDAGDPTEKLKAGSVEIGFKVFSKAGNPLVNNLTRTLLSPYGECDFNMQGGGSRAIPMYRG